LIGKKYGPQKPVPLISKGSLPEPEQEEKWGNYLTWIHLENGCHNRDAGSGA